MQLVSSAENSSLDWQAQYAYIEDIADGRGYTAGIIGFCTGTGDVLELVQAYTATRPDNPLAAYVSALESVNGTDSHDGLDPGFTAAWKEASADPAFQSAQEDERDRIYFNPAINFSTNACELCASTKPTKIPRVSMTPSDALWKPAT